MDGQYLQQLASGYAPVVSGRNPLLLTGMEGVPGMNQGGAMGIAAQMLLAPYLQSTMQQYGYTPMGMGHDINRYDVMRHQQFATARLGAMQEAAGLDTAGYEDTFRGIAAVTGTPFGIRQRRAAKAIAQSTSAFSPVLADMMPEFMDQMGGSAGSAVVMAGRLSEANRYRIDPLTGQMGYSQGSTSAQTKDLYKSLYSDGNIASMRGITAGQLGTMYDELNRRGMVDGYSGDATSRAREAISSLSFTDPEKLKSAAAKQNVSLPKNISDLGIDDLDKLKLDPAVEDKLRSFDSSKVKKSLKSYVDAVSAMRDIFGDMGRPDAPMRELINSLEVLTQNGMSNVDPGKLNMMVRTTSELAKQSGMSIDSVMVMQQHAAAKAQSLGIDTSHAVEATQGNMAWSSAFTAQGGNSQAAWGRMDSNQMRQLDMNLRVQAAASEQAQKLAVLARVSKTVGGFEKGSEAEAITSAITSGQTEFQDPTTKQIRSTLISGTELTEMLVGAKSATGQNLGITQGTVAELMNQRKENEESIKEYDIGGQVRKQQPAEIREWLSNRYRESMSTRLAAAGMDKEEAVTIARRASANVARRVSGMSQSDFANDGIRTDLMAGIMKDELQLEGAGKFIQEKKLGDDFFKLSAEAAYGKIGRDIQYGGLSSYQNYQNLHALNDKAAMEQADKNTMQAVLSAKVADSLSGMSKGSMLQRTVDYLKEAGDDPDKASFGAMLSKAAGGEASEELQEKMEGPIREINKARKVLEKMKSDLLKSESSPEKTELKRKFDEKSAELKKQVADLVNLGERHGVTTDKAKFVSTEESQAVLTKLETLKDNTFDVMASLGAKTAPILDSDVKARIGTRFTDPNAARAIIMERELKTMNDSITAENIAEVKKELPLPQRTDKVARSRLEQANRAYLERQQAIETGQIKREATDEYEKPLFSDAAVETQLQDDTWFGDGFYIKTDEEARLVIKNERDGMAYRASAEDIQAKAKADGITEKEAEAKLNVELRDKKFAITADEKATAKKLLPKEKQTDFDVQMQVLQSRQADEYEVTSAEISEHRKANPHTSKYNDETIVKEIRKATYEQKRAAYDELMQTESGQEYSRETLKTFQAAEDVAGKVVLSKDMQRKVGPAGVDTSKKTLEAYNQLQAIAATNTEGDLAKLVQGQYTNVTDPKEIAQTQKKVSELMDTLKSGTESVKKMSSGDTPTWGDNKLLARELLGHDKDKNLGWLTDENTEFKKKVADLDKVSKLKSDDLKKVEDFDKVKEEVGVLAKRFNVTPEAAIKFIESGDAGWGLFTGPKLFTPLTDKETATVDSVRGEWRGKYKEIERVRDNIKANELRLKEKGLDQPNKDSIQKNITELKAKETTIKTAMDKISNPVNQMAVDRDMREEQFMIRYESGDLVTPAHLKAMAEVGERYKTAEKALPEGVKAKDTDTVIKTQKEVDKRNEKIADAALLDPTALLKSAFESAGLPAVTYSEEISAAGKNVSDRGQILLEQTNATVDRLGKAAKTRAKDADSRAKSAWTGAGKKEAETEKRDLEGNSLAGAGELSDLYDLAKKNTDIARFRKSINMDGSDKDKEFATFEGDIDFLKRANLATYDDIAIDKRSSFLQNAMSNIGQGIGFAQGGPSPSGGAVGTVVEIKGSVHISGETADVNLTPTQQR